MKYHFVSFGKKTNNLNCAIERRVIGSSGATFHTHISKGSVVFLHCAGQIVGKAKVVSDGFTSNERIWLDKLYPYRFQIDDVVLLSNPYFIAGSESAIVLREEYGPSWAYKFLFVPKPLPDTVGTILSKLFDN